MANEMKEKALQVKQDMDQLIDAGKQSVIANSKYIEKQASGKVIRLDDVSEVAHKVKVYGDNTEVKVYEKNLFNNDTSLLKSITYTDSSGTTRTKTGYEIELPVGNYTFTLTDLDTSIKKYVYGCICDKDYNNLRGCDLLQVTNNYTPLNITVNEGEKVVIYDGYSPKGQTATDVFNAVQIQLEAGSGGTPFEEYKEPQTITATPNGTEIFATCPNMTFFADNDITVDYYGSYGRQAEYDKYWDNYQDYGKRTSYGYAFCRTGWTNSNFQPKYDIALTSGEQMFYYSKITDLAGILKKQSVVMDTSKATNVTYMYGYSSLTRIPTTDLSSATNTTYLCSGDTGLVSIEKIVSSETTVFANSAFNNCTALEHCIFEGTIASDINLQWSKKLDLESLKSIIYCLKNYSADDPDNEFTKTVTLSAESWALLAADSMSIQGTEYYWEDQIYNNGWLHE